MTGERAATEKEFRAGILRLAKEYGCDIEIKQIMQRYDNILKRCTNQKERQQIATMGVAEIHKYLDCRGELVVDGQLVIPGEKIK